MNDNRKHARRIRHEATMLQGTTGAPLNNEQYERWLAYAVENHAGDWMETWCKFCAGNPEIGEAVSRMPARQGQVATAKCVTATSPGASASGALSEGSEE